MSDAKSPQDLSMDEILATIRRIIAEDERAGAASGPAGLKRAPGVGPEAAPVEPAASDADVGANDVLDLTDALNEDGTVRRLVPAGSPSPPERAPEPPLAAGPAAVDDQAQRGPATDAGEAEPGRELPAEAAGPRPERQLPADADGARAGEPAAEPVGAGRASEERLVSEITSLAAAAAFARVASAPRARREPPLVGDRPLDEVVCDLLRPLLRAWLDENLPGIVERLVEAEIARVARCPAGD